MYLYIKLLKKLWESDTVIIKNIINIFINYKIFNYKNI